MAVETVEIVDSMSGATARIAPSLGFNCFSFRACNNGQAWETLWSDPLFTTGTQRPSRSGIPLLFPFPGRLRGKMLQYAGQTYELDATDPNGNGIHGFVYTRPWRVVERAANQVTGEFQASVDDPSLSRRWPGDFRIRASYEVAANRLYGSYEFHNPGSQPLPWGFGTHPYFRVPIGTGNANDCLVRMPLTKRWELNNSLPTGKLLEEPNAERYAAGIPFGEAQFDDVFAGLVLQDGVWTGSVTDAAAKRRTTIRFGEPFRECVVFTPPHREAICLEPYSCVANAYELSEQGLDTGLRFLAPGATETLWMEITGESWEE